MPRFLRWITRLSAFRIGLAAGLFFAALHVVQLAGRYDVPLLTRLESAMVDARFLQRARLGVFAHSDRVVVAAIDEAAIAKFGRWPWDRRVIASLVDKLNQQGVAAIGFDMSLSDEDLGGQFAGAKRYRKRFEEVSLASGRNLAAVERFREAQTDVSGASSALRALSRSVRPDGERVYQAAKGRLSDGVQKLSASREDFDALVKQHEGYAAELDHELTGLDPDQVLGEAIAKASGKVVLGWVALTEPEMQSFKPGEVEEQAKRMEKTRIHLPELRQQVDGVELAKPQPDAWVKEYPGLRAPLAPIARGATWFGFFNTLPDPDGVIRRTALTVRVAGRYFPSLDAALVGVALGIKPQDIVPLTQDDTHGAHLEAVDFGGKRRVAVDDRGLMEINYVGRDRSFQNWSIADLLEGRYDGRLKDRIVLVGATAQGTFDQRVTPFNQSTAGIETHANAVENILSGHGLRRGLTVNLLELVALLVLAVGCALVFSRVRVGLALPVFVGTGVVLWVAASVAFSLGWNVIAALPLVEVASIFVLVTVFRYATEERDKRQLRKAFQLYLNPDVMEEMLQQPEMLQLGGNEQELTVLFSDIRGFTSISEKLAPPALVKLLNEYLSPMTDIVFAKRGTLDKYIGDAVMAFFGAPVSTDRHAVNGCDAALEMIEELARLRERWNIEDPSLPDLDIGIGINSGPMVVGNMGSAQRFNYTVMGDNVNLASRLEGLNKEYGTHILISEQTLRAAERVEGRGAWCVRELDAVRVKGKKEPVVLFELRHRGPADTFELPLLDAYAEGLRLYRAQRFAEARLQFESLLERFPGDGPSTLFLRRCDEMSATPPGQTWDGVFRMEHK